MKQQVNLYKTLPHVSRNWFGELLVLQIASGFVALMFLVTLVQLIMLQWGKHNIGLLEKKYIESNTRFSREQKSQTTIDLVQLQQELASKTQLLGVLHIKTHAEGSCPLLSDYFQSFSAAQTSGIWLTKFVIEPDTRNMTLNGVSYEPLLIVRWVKQLGATPCFAGVTFHTIDIQNSLSETNKSLMMFGITSMTTPIKPVGKK